MSRNSWANWTLSAALGLATGAAQASVTLLTDESFSTLSSTNVAATIQADGTESGGIRLLSNGTPSPAPSNTIAPFRAITLGELGLTNAADFRLIVAPQETDNTFSISTLGVTFFDPDGTQLFIGTAATTFALNTLTMAGQGFVFGFDAASAAAAQLAFANPNNVIGVFGTFINSTGGPETLYVANRLDVSVPAVPEPATLALLAAGLASGLGLARRRQRA